MKTLNRVIAVLTMIPALAVAATTTPIQLLSPAGSTAGQAIVSTGASSAPAWGSPAALASQAANTVLANFTASPAAPVAFPMPSCSTSTSALQYTTGTGITCYANSAATTGTLAQFAATTSAQVAGVVSDETGSGLLVFATSPSFSGTATFVGATFSGGLVPSQTSGIVGTTTNNNVAAGSFGEYLNNSTSATALTTAVGGNCTSVALTAGDWDVSGAIQFVAGGTTTVQQLIAGIGTASATLGPVGTTQALTLPFTTGSTNNLSTPTVRFSLAAPATAYLVGSATFAVSTMTCNGSIRARRVR
jgi:hypothetical protein